jgi:hypothetical protein
MPLYPQGGGLYPNSIDNVLLADMAAATIKGRAAGAGAGDPQDLTMAQLAAMSGGMNYRNLLGRNGGFEVWQRGAGGSASFAIAASGAQYTADGWFFACGPNEASVVLQAAAGGVVLGSRYCASVQRNAGQTGTSPMVLEYPLDSDEITVARGAIVTLSLMIWMGSTWSPAGGNIQILLYTGTGAPARRSLGAYTAETIVINVVQPITSTPTRYSFTSSVPVPATTTQASVFLVWTPVGVAGAADQFVIDDVQLEVGSVATPFERRPFESELLACMRHYQKTFPYATAPAQNVGFAGAIHTMQIAGPSGFQAFSMRYPVRMRAAPTVIGFNPAAANNFIRNSWTNTDWTAVSLVPHSNDATMIVGGNTPAGSVAAQEAYYHVTSDAGI